MPDTKLTKRQTQVLQLIRESLRTRGFPPTVRELCQALGCRSPNAVHRLLRVLAQKGYLERSEQRRSRAFRLTIGQDLPAPSLSQASLVSVPVLSNGFFGSAEELFEHANAYITLDARLFPQRPLYAVAMPDEALSAEGILPGDLLLAVRSSELREGCIVGALLHGLLLVRRLRKRDSAWELSASARSFPPIRFREGEPDVAVVLHVIGLIRTPELKS
jgi:repressor LexA